jgi:hypothetical protein
VLAAKQDGTVIGKGKAFRSLSQLSLKMMGLASSTKVAGKTEYLPAENGN